MFPFEAELFVSYARIQADGMCIPVHIALNALARKNAFHAKGY